MEGSRRTISRVYIVYIFQACENETKCVHVYNIVFAAFYLRHQQQLDRYAYGTTPVQDYKSGTQPPNNSHFQLSIEYNGSILFLLEPYVMNQSVGASVGVQSMCHVTSEEGAADVSVWGGTVSDS